MTGGAACAISSIPGYRLARDRTKMWSFASTHTPPSSPVTQRSGRGFGQDGSTSNCRLLCAELADCARTPRGSHDDEVRTTAATNAHTATYRLLFIAPPLEGGDYRCQSGWITREPVSIANC